MALLGKAQDLWEVDDLETEDIEVPEWKIGGEAVTIRLKALSGEDRDAYEASMVKMVKGKQVPDVVNARARLVVLSAVDENGDKLFADVLDVVKLGQKNSKAVNRLWEHACTLSGIDFDGSLAADDAEHFSNAQNGPSTSG
jgi:hypothetical protein